MDDKYYAWTDTVDGAMNEWIDRWMDVYRWMDGYCRWMINIVHGQIL